MSNAILKSLTLTFKTNLLLGEMSDKYDIAQSKHIRMFLNYFNDNKKELEELFKNYEEVCGK